MRFVHPYAIFSEMFEQKFLKFIWTQHGLQLSHPALWSHRGCLHTSLLSSFLLLISQNIAKHCRRAMWFLLPVYFEELFIFQGRNIPEKNCLWCLSNEFPVFKHSCLILRCHFSLECFCWEAPILFAYSWHFQMWIRDYRLSNGRDLILFGFSNFLHRKILENSCPISIQNCNQYILKYLYHLRAVFLSWMDQKVLRL